MHGREERRMRRLAGEEQPLRDRRGKRRPRRRMAGQCMRIGAERPAVAPPFGLGKRLRPAAKRRAEKFAQFIERKGGQRPLRLRGSNPRHCGRRDRPRYKGVQTGAYDRIRSRPDRSGRRNAPRPAVLQACRDRRKAFSALPSGRPAAASILSGRLGEKTIRSLARRFVGTATITVRADERALLRSRAVPARCDDRLR